MSDKERIALGLYNKHAQELYDMGVRTLGELHEKLYEIMQRENVSLKSSAVKRAFGVLRGESNINVFEFDIERFNSRNPLNVKNSKRISTKRQYSREDLEYLIPDLQKEGMSLQEIAEYLNVSVSTVYNNGWIRRRSLAA